MSAQNLSSTFMRTIWQTVVLIIVAAIFFFFYALNEKKFDDVNQLKYKSSHVADEMRQSSEDLTRMVRTYIVTKNKLYKQHYQEILDIRNGLKPRPLNYDDIYWDLVDLKDKRPRAFSKKNIPLSKKFEELNLSKQERSKLFEAKKNSDELTKIEYTAMKLIKKNSNKGANFRKALSLLYGEQYHKAKAKVMKPLNEFDTMLENRLNNLIQKTRKLSWILLSLVILISMILLFMLKKIYRDLISILGGDIDTVHKTIKHLGGGEFSILIQVAQKNKNSVLGWLKETQTNLLELSDKNERLKNLYAALSQCNQAIVRSKNKEELFNIICHDAIRFGGMKMAIIGLLDESAHLIKPVAHAGEGIGYVDLLRISTDPKHPSSAGPIGQTFLNNKPYWIQDFMKNPMMKRWQGRGKEYGWGSIASLPLVQENKVIGVFVLYSYEINAFDEEAKELLEEMATDINYALDGFKKEEKRQQAEDELFESRNILVSIINTAPVRIFWKDRDLRYLGGNLAFAKDAGEDSIEKLIGKKDTELNWKNNAEVYSITDKKVIQEGISQLFYEERENTYDGKDIWLSKSKVPLHGKDDEVIGLLGVYEDITQRKEAEKRNKYLANYDLLTNLPNRAYLNNQFKYILNVAKRGKENIAVMLLDIDHFKDINDTLGHDTGDMLLKEFAKRLQTIFRKIDIISRLGGDEFIIILPSVDMNGAGLVAQKIIEHINKPFIVKKQELSITTSIGIAIYPEDGLDFSSLYKNTDIAMYRAKGEGRNCFSFFTKEMQKNSARNLKLNNTLFRALEKDEFELYYQPQISSDDGEIIGAEALLRWNNSELGMISPAEFIPVAENNGLIIPIGEWVIKSAVKQAKIWMDKGMKPIIIAVNISAVQFRHLGLPQSISDILEFQGLPPEYLEIELTEGVAMKNPKRAVETMDNLHERGIRMSIDDFGTGYSSLSYLKKFKIYKLKIDQSFVRDINTDEEDKKIVSTIINMSKNLGLKTIAEGVETIGQLEYLKEQGCDEIQGYYYSKPLPAKDFEAFRKDFKIKNGSVQ